MIDLTIWTNQFLQALDETFGERVWFAGLQGSYGRGEATESSDLDLVVILDALSAPDLARYHTMLDGLPHRELLCGFLSGKRELMNWEPSDLFQFYYDTQPLRGSLDELLLRIDDAAVQRAIKLGACNIFHGCVHNMLYEKSEDMLRGLYKAASFVVQAICFQQTGSYVRRQTALADAVSPEDSRIVRTFLALKQGGAVAFQPMSETLLTWSQRWIAP